jgi:hypothetical protein
MKMKLLGVVTAVVLCAVTSPAYSTAFLLNPDGSHSDIIIPAFSGPFPYAINDAGQIVGWFKADLPPPAGSFPQGFLYSGGSYTALNVPGAYQTIATGINNTSQIVGYYSSGNFTGGSSIAEAATRFSVFRQPSAPSHPASTTLAKL